MVRSLLLSWGRVDDILAKPFFVHKIFQMDYNQHTNEFRMLDHFLPQVCETIM